MTVRRFCSLVGSMLVIAIAAIASYSHQRDLALRAHQNPVIAALIPLSVDGLVMVATLALGDGRDRKAWARAAIIAGAVATLTANIADAHPDPLSRCVSAAPPVAMLFLIEVLGSSRRRTQTVTTQVATSTVKQQVRATVSAPKATVPRGRKAAPAQQKAAEIAAAAPELHPGQVATLAGVSRSTARRARASLKDHRSDLDVAVRTLQEA